MGLDIYAGTLTRYYYHNWKTAVQQWAEANGYSFQKLAPDGSPVAEEELTPEEELEDGIIELVDEDENVVKFRLLGVTEYKGAKYTLLLPAEPNDDVEEDEVVIFTLNEEEQTLDPIEDEQLLQEVFDFYLSEQDEEEN